MEVRYLEPDIQPKVSPCRGCEEFMIGNEGMCFMDCILLDEWKKENDALLGWEEEDAQP